MNEDQLEGVESALMLEIDRHAKAEPGSEEARICCENISKLSKIIQDESKIVIEKESDNRKQEFEERKTAEEAETKKKQSKKDDIFGYIRLGLDASAIIVPATVTVIWLAICNEIERDGAITSNVTRWISNRIRLTK